MTNTRRRFLKLVAAGAAAAVTAPAQGLARTVRRRTTTRPQPVKPAAPDHAAPSERIAAEIEKQKGYVAAALKTLRAYELPNGSEQAFVFRPVPARKERRS